MEREHMGASRGGGYRREGDQRSERVFREYVGRRDGHGDRGAV